MKAKILKNLNQLNEASTILEDIYTKCPHHLESLKALIEIHILNKN